MRNQIDVLEKKIMDKLLSFHDDLSKSKKFESSSIRSLKAAFEIDPKEFLAEICEEDKELEDDAYKAFANVINEGIVEVNLRTIDKKTKIGQQIEVALPQFKTRFSRVEKIGKMIYVASRRDDKEFNDYINALNSEEGEDRDFLVEFYSWLESSLSEFTLKQVIDSMNFVTTSKIFLYEMKKLKESTEVATEEINRKIKKTTKIEKKIYSNMLTIIAILVAIFSLIGVNFSIFVNARITIESLALLEVMLIAVITWIFALIDNLINEEPKIKLDSCVGYSVIFVYLGLIIYMALNNN